MTARPARTAAPVVEPANPVDAMPPSCHGPGGSSSAPSLAGPRTPDDDGRPDPALATALAGWERLPEAAGEARVYAALPAARLFVPVVATLVESETAVTGLRAEKTSAMSVVTLVAPSGATALPAFLSTESLRRWRLDARPVPVSGQEACLAALDGGHAAVVVEPGALTFPVHGTALESLASGWVPAAGGGSGRTSSVASRRVAHELRLQPPEDPLPASARDRVSAALRLEPVVREAFLVDVAVGSEPPARTVGLVLGRDVPAAELAGLVGRLGEALGPALAEVGGLDLVVLGAAQRDEALRVGEPLLASVAGPAQTGSARRRWWRRA